MSEVKTKPDIRFAGFADDWERQELSVLADFSKGQGYSKGDLKESGTPVILYGRLYTKYETVISAVDTFVRAKEKSVFSRGGEVIVPASGETAEDISRASVVDNKGIILGGDLNILQPRSIVDPVFLALTISNGERQKELSRRAQGKTVVHIHNSDLREVSLSYPDLAEQIRIGSIFRKLDSFIDLQQREYDKTVSIKKAMLEKMFPKAGADRPEIRFAGFTAAWEQRKLGEIASDVVRPISLKDEELYQLVTVKRRNEGVTSRGFLKGKNILVKNYFEIQSDDYIVSKRQVIHGGNGLVPEHLDKAVVSNEYLVLVSNDFISTKFWALISNCRWFHRLFFLSSYGVDIEKMVFNVDDWKKRTVIIPSIREQNKIIECFEGLDRLITLHQREFTKLQNIKKALLEKMFV